MSLAFVEGIDVSSNQENLDWGAVSKTGVSFVFARASAGGHQTDSQFATNWSGISDAGLIRGAYHYFWPLTPWQDQAANFIKAVGSLQVGSLPPALDLEEAVAKNDPRKRDVWNDVPANRRLLIIQNWLDRVEQALNTKPMIYTRQNFIENLLGNGVVTLAEYPLWIAHYDVLEPAVPGIWVSWAFWQYSEKGVVEGIKGNVDRNRFNGSLDKLQALAKK